MTLESFCEGWGISLYVLVRQHTLGQLILMATAANIRSHEATKETEQTGKPGSTAATAGGTVPSFRPKKPFKQQTSDEYRQFIEHAGAGIV